MYIRRSKKFLNSSKDIVGQCPLYALFQCLSINVFSLVSNVRERPIEPITKP